jgi:hypothetical protein
MGYSQGKGRHESSRKGIDQFALASLSEWLPG